MTSSEIRQSFLDFFREKSHTIVPSSSLMPDAPNLLFTNAGMNQFVPFFLGERDCPYKPPRAADTQKCIRAGGKHNDLEDVGYDTYHHTFFEMLGNWSFGDYFKQEAIQWAWELLVDRWGFPPDRLYATVYKPGPNDPAEFDHEAHDLWTEIFTAAGVDPAVHIVNGGRKDNFWMMGDTGPCGPCSEIHMDLTPGGDTRGALVNADDARCIEIWNLVFIQFNANADGSYTPLPARHVDTGMGFERVCSIIQGTNGFTDFESAHVSNYETDVFHPIFRAIEELTGHTYHCTLPPSGEAVHEDARLRNDVAFRVLADHIRALTFSIADGILPSNEGRGYVLRRILRRAVRYGRNLGQHDLFFYKLVDTLTEQLGTIFPQLAEHREQVTTVIRGEEENFSKTLDRGIELFEQISKGIPHGGRISGKDAFRLYDTYGFPLDLTQLMARECGLSVDVTEFEACMEAQRARSKASQKKTTIEVLESDGIEFETTFVGYDQPTDVTIEKFEILHDPKSGKPRLLMSPTPFYGEMGGQVGDTGAVKSEAAEVRIHDTVRTPSGEPLHLPENAEAIEQLEGSLIASVDTERRERIEAHHSGTHILHWALREVLGPNVRQKGSHVSPDHLRFDFSHVKAVEPAELETIERLINERIAENSPVSTSERPYEEVRNDPTVLQFFGDKYGEVVRVVDIGGFSKELCGGTHVGTTSEIGPLRVTHEGAIAAGIRRVEAYSGEALRRHTLEQIARQDNELRELLERTGAKGSLPAADAAVAIEDLWAHYVDRSEKLAAIEQQIRDHQKNAAKQEQAALQSKAAEKARELIAAAEPVGSAQLIIADLGEIDSKFPNLLGTELKKQFAGAAFAVGTANGRATLLATSGETTSQMLPAGKWLQTVAPIVDGKGGGRPDQAQGGGTNPAKIPDLLREARDYARTKLPKGA